MALIARLKGLCMRNALQSNCCFDRADKASVFVTVMEKSTREYPISFGQDS